MSDAPSVTDAPRNSTNTVIIVLVVAVVVLAAGIGYAIWNNSQSVPAITSLPADTATDPMAGAATGAMPGAATGAAATSAEFDPATATKCPAGTTPEGLVKAYHEAVASGKFAEAYKMLPLAKQQSYGDAAAYAAQVKAYGITGYEMGTPTENGDQVAIAATQVTPQMPITYTWTFKKVGDTWYVVSRDMGGSTE